MMKTARYGWLPDLPDHRDLRVPRLSSLAIAGLPPAEDLRMYCPPIYDQGNLGSCTAQAGCGLAEFIAMKQGEPSVRRSRLQLYYDERVLEGSEDWDAGAYLRDCLKVLVNTGVAPEIWWPYDIGKFRIKPQPEVYVQAERFQTLRYARLDQDLGQLKGCLAGGLPFISGFSVYENFEDSDTAATGIANMPSGSLLGGHAVMTVGYDDATQRFLCRNSWGVGWGMAGYFTIPYAYWLDNNLSDDFWTVQKVE